MNARRGFSLIEVLIVLLIIVMVVGSMTMNLFGRLAEERLQGGIDALALEMEAARVEAMTRGEVLWLRYDPAQNSIRLERSPELLVADHLRKDLESRRRAFQSTEGEILREFVFEPESVILKAVRVGNRVHRESVSILFGPDGQGETHRVLLGVPEADDQFAFEYSGVLGRMSEMTAEAFERDSFDEYGTLKLLIDDEDFFNGQRPTGVPRPEVELEGYE